MGILVRVLGPTVLEVDGVNVDLPRQQARALAVLASRAPAAASRDLVVDALWGERPPPSAGNAVQVHMSGLRKAAATAGWPEAFVLTDRGGYRLAEQVDVDAVLLRRTVRAAIAGLGGRSATDRVAAWDDSRLALHSGPLVDLEDVGACLDSRAELTALVQQARALRREDLLVAGRAAQVVAELVPVVGAEAGNEELAGVLARAQYLLGRQVDALRTLAAHRSAMAEEFGLDPSPGMVELERRILLQDPGLVPRDRAPVIEVRPVAQDSDTRPVGRDALIADVLNLVATRPGLVTLVGPGGIGKTTVATAIARLLQEHELPRPVVMVGAATWPVDADVLTGFARAVVPADEADAYGTAVSAVRTSGAIVILDNLEHLDRATEQVATLVRDLGAAVLATSRRPVGIPDERVVRVPALDARADGPAVEVFLRAARRAGCTRPADELGELGEVVSQHVGGLPLGIELAASWLRVLDPGALRDQLGLSLYATTASAVPSRQRSLSRMVDDALRLVSPTAVLLFDRLGLGAGGARLPVVEALLAVDGDPAGSPVAAVLGELFDAGLVRSVADADGAFRYQLLPAVRERATHRLEAQGRATVDAARTAWASATAAMVAELGVQVRTAAGLAVRQVLRIEIAHVVAAVAWLGENGAAELALEAACQLRNFAELESRVAEVCALVESTLGVEHGLSDAARIRALNTLALLYPHLDRAPDARRAAETALGLALDLGDDVLAGRLHTTLAGLLVDAQRLGEAVQHLDAAESLRVTEGDVLGIATVRTHRGLALLRERRHEDAVHALRAVLEVPGIEQFPDAAATARYNVALAVALTGDVGAAAGQLLVVLDDAVAIDEQEMLAYVAVATAVAAGGTRPTACVAMAGLALTALRRLGEELEGVEATALDEAIAAARRVLGDAAFSRTFAEGAAVGAEDVAARIRGELEAAVRA